MTLILSLLAKKYAMQASDRRVTRLNRADEVVGHDDERGKAILVAERMTFAYTGHAEIGGPDTAEFFQSRMAADLNSGKTIEQSLERIAAQYANYFRSLRPDTDRHHAFVGVGWDATTDSAPAPILLCASNAMDENGEWLPDPREEFQTFRQTLDQSDDPYLLLVAGAQMSTTARGHLHAQLGSIISETSDPAPVGRLLIETIHAEAAHNPAVGKGVMLNCLPISPDPPNGDVHLVGGEPTLESRTFSYVPAESFDGHWLGPLVATSDGDQLGDFHASVVDAQNPGVGMTYRPSSAPARPRAAVGQRVRDYKIGRNDPCWCGSGKKHKKCHGG